MAERFPNNRIHAPCHPVVVARRRRYVLLETRNGQPVVVTLAPAPLRRRSKSDGKPVGPVFFDPQVMAPVNIPVRELGIRKEDLVLLRPHEIRFSPVAKWLGVAHRLTQLKFLRALRTARKTRKNAGTERRRNG